jgi:hypothetical protein
VHAFTVEFPTDGGRSEHSSTVVLPDSSHHVDAVSIA